MATWGRSETTCHLQTHYQLRAGALQLHHCAWNPAQHQWQALPKPIIKGSVAAFAPANIKCSAENTVYKQLIDEWIARGFTLRYSGGMVPDVHQLLIKVRLQPPCGATNPHEF